MVVVTTGMPTVVVVDTGVTVGVPIGVVVVLDKEAEPIVCVPAGGVGDELQAVEAVPLVHVVDPVGVPGSILGTVLELTLLGFGPAVVITGAPHKLLVQVTVLVTVVV